VRSTPWALQWPCYNPIPPGLGDQRPFQRKPVFHPQSECRVPWLAETNWSKSAAPIHVHWMCRQPVGLSLAPAPRIPPNKHISCWSIFIAHWYRYLPETDTTLPVVSVKERYSTLLQGRCLAFGISATSIPPMTQLESRLWLTALIVLT